MTASWNPNRQLTIAGFPLHAQSKPEITSAITLSTEDITTSAGVVSPIVSLPPPAQSLPCPTQSFVGKGTVPPAP